MVPEQQLEQGRAAAGGPGAQAAWPYVDKDDPWSSHSRIAAWLARLPPGTRVLDVGAATGTLGRMCAGRGFAITGVEPNPAWAEVARRWYTAMRCGTIDAIGDAALSGHDVVVCADVLEHLADPEATLRRLVALQPEGSTFVVSVPNVANLWVRLQLLRGRFDYTDRGILDRTHLRFFTRRTLAGLLARAGLRPVALQATPIPLNLVHPWFRTVPGRLVHRALAYATSRLPTLLGYQFVVRATKRPE